MAAGEGWWRVCSRATTTGGAWFHAPPVNSKTGGQIFSFSSSSCLRWSSGDLHKQRKHRQSTKAAEKTKKIKFPDLFSASSGLGSVLFLLLLFLFFSPEVEGHDILSKTTCKTKAKHKQRQQAKNIPKIKSSLWICFLLFGFKIIFSVSYAATGHGWGFCCGLETKRKGDRGWQLGEGERLKWWSVGRLKWWSVGWRGRLV